MVVVITAPPLAAGYLLPRELLTEPHTKTNAASTYYKTSNDNGGYYSSTAKNNNLLTGNVSGWKQKFLRPLKIFLVVQSVGSIIFSLLKKET